MTSIRGQLQARLLPPIAILVVVSIASLYVYVRHVLDEDFDAMLVAKARAVAAAVRWDDEKPFEIVSPDVASEEFSHDKHAEYFQIRRSDGTSALRSSSLGDGDLRPLPAAPDRAAFADVKLPDGRSGREVVIGFVPTRDPDDVAIPVSASSADVQMTLVLARSRHFLDEPLTVLLTALSIGSVAFIAGAMLIVILAVRRSLHPLTAMARDAASDPALAMDQRFAVEGMPIELAPICRYLNELIGQLQTAFVRERRFTADVAHELRTPIAELRAITEVALRYPATAAENSETLSDALAISRHMESVVTTLLALARCHSGYPSVTAESIDMAALVQRLWRPLADNAAQKHISVEFEIPPSAPIETNPMLVSGVVSNLLSNAAAYCPSGGRIVCRVAGNADALSLEVSNTVESLTADDLAHMFEPFWRKDQARSSGSHFGLGLALAQAYCKVLGASLTASRTSEREIQLVFRLPRSAPRPAASAGFSSRSGSAEANALESGRSLTPSPGSAT
jgi:two-component system sensor histidine kinase QseC